VPQVSLLRPGILLVVPDGETKTSIRKNKFHISGVVALGRECENRACTSTGARQPH
jgi:hypothetical protein